MSKMDKLDVLHIAPGMSPPSCPYRQIEPTSTEEKLAQAILVVKGSGSSLLSMHQADTWEGCEASGSGPERMMGRDA